MERNTRISYVCVILKNSKEIIVVPHTWINLSASRVFNGAGAKKFVERKIYYSPNASTKATFTLPIREQFDETINSCYLGKCLMGFGKFGRDI